jgi:hypothetical protein
MSDIAKEIFSDARYTLIGTTNLTTQYKNGFCERTHSWTVSVMTRRGDLITLDLYIKISGSSVSIETSRKRSIIVGLDQSQVTKDLIESSAGLYAIQSFVTDPLNWITYLPTMKIHQVN